MTKRTTYKDSDYVHRSLAQIQEDIRVSNKAREESDRETEN